MSILNNQSQKIEVERIVPDSFYETSITRTLKPDRDITRKESHRQICVMNIGTKFPNKTIKFNIVEQKFIHHCQITFVPGMQNWFNIQKSNNVIHDSIRLKQKNHMIIPIIDYKKAIFQFPFMIKTLSKLEIRG